MKLSEVLITEQDGDDIVFEHCDCDYCSYHREVDEPDLGQELQELQEECEYLQLGLADSMGEIFRALDEGDSNDDVLLAIFAHEAELTRLKLFLLE